MRPDLSDRFLFICTASLSILRSNSERRSAIELVEGKGHWPGREQEGMARWVAALAQAVKAGSLQVQKPTPHFNTTPFTSHTVTWIGMPCPTLCVTVQNDSN